MPYLPHSALPLAGVGLILDAWLHTRPLCVAAVRRIRRLRSSSVEVRGEADAAGEFLRCHAPKCHAELWRREAVLSDKTWVVYRSYATMMA